MRVPWRRAASMASRATAGVVADSAAKMPPVWNQRAPWPAPPKIASQSTAPGASCAIAVWPRSEQPTPPRGPKPRSVKLSPLRLSRPTPSYLTQRRNDRSTPPCNIRSSTRRPTGLSASAVTIAVRRPKQRRSPRATLYSPPPSQAVKVRVVWMRPSPGSRRSITSPRLTSSKRHCAAVLIVRLLIVGWSVALDFASELDVHDLMLRQNARSSSTESLTRGAWNCHVFRVAL